MKSLYSVAALALVVPIGWQTAAWFENPSREIDPALAEAGDVLFLHEWTKNDPLAAGGDGLGPVFNAKSCVACHFQGGTGGGGPNKRNVVAFTVRSIRPGETARQGVVHASAVKSSFRETLKHVHPSLPLKLPVERVAVTTMADCFVSSFRFPDGVNVSERNTPALFGANLIDEIPDRVIIANERRQRLKWGMATHEIEHAPVGRVHRLTDGRVGRFGWKGQTASLGDFVRAACANELGLGNPAQSQPAPLGHPDYRPPGIDLTDMQCNQITAFIGSLPCPVETLPETPAQRENAIAGKQLFHAVGCADCHTPQLGHVDGIYSDLLLHRMGQTLVGGGSYNDPPLPASPDIPQPGDKPHPSEWQTPPLWGVASSAPYLHDGRAGTLNDAIVLHSGQATRAATHFRNLSGPEQTQLISFLETLQAPPPNQPR
jgi:CxxC motif-containing protein (DUF1111 family)